MFAAIRRITRAVDVPVSADVEAGYGLPAEELVERLLEAGAAGCNLEDSDPRSRALVEPKAQADYLARVRAAAGDALVLNARIDTYLRGERTTAAAVERGLLYVAAGADCVYPIMCPPEVLADLAEGIGAPLNALCKAGGRSPRELGVLGATRVTFGGGLHHQSLDALRGSPRACARSRTRPAARRPHRRAAGGPGPLPIRAVRASFRHISPCCAVREESSPASTRSSPWTPA